MLKKIEFIFLVLMLFGVVFISGCIQKEISEPETKTPVERIAKVYGREVLETGLPPEKAIERFLPDLNYSWKLVKSDEGSTLTTLSEIPRVPNIAFKKNVSANIGGPLATPLVENGKIFLADHERIYALDDNGELIWGVEIWSELLGHRPWPQWRALGFYRFVESYGLGKYFFVGTSSSEGGNGYLLAFKKSTGELVWKAELEPESNASSLPSVTSNLIVAEGKVCVGTVRDEGYVFCFTEDGDFLWRNKIGGNVRGLAYGDGILFATSEPFKSVHAFNIKTGEKLWRYDHDDIVGTPVYKEDKIFFIDSLGRLIVISSKGEKLWEKNVYGGGDVNTNSFLAIGNAIYTPRNIGERPLNLYVIDFDGNFVGKFELEEEEKAGAPVVTKNIVLLPVVSNGYAKIYFLWKGINKLYEFKFEGDEIFMPKMSVAYGSIYAVFSHDRSNHVLIKFEDFEKPEIKRVEETKHNESVDVKALIQDEQSGIYKALVAYKDSEWHYVEMELARRYAMEPIGGYGFNEEEYIATIPKTEYVVIAIDNAGNYDIL